MQPTASIKEHFASTFGSAPRIHVLRSPGRVNLIGEHTDYNEGFVFPMAIEPEIRIACRARDDNQIRLASASFPGQLVEFSINKKITAGEPTWANYARGVAAEMLDAGIPLTGMDALIENTLPVGGGLSSSAAYEVGIAKSLLTLGGHDLDLTRLALLCQKAEHEYARVPCGIMDQTIVASGRAGHAMLLDCRDHSMQFIPIDANDLRVVIVNTMIRHELSGSEYATRRKQCEEGVAFFARLHPNVKALRDVGVKQVEEARSQLSDVVYRRCRHVVTENHRATDAARLLGRQEYEDVGKLMNQSHISMRDDYEISCAELDFLAEEAIKIKGVYGARMTGGGFGGCIVALVQPRAVDHLIDHLNKSYSAKFNIQPTAFVTAAAPGASVLE